MTIRIINVQQQYILVQVSETKTFRAMIDLLVCFVFVNIIFCMMIPTKINVKAPLHLWNPPNYSRCTNCKLRRKDPSPGPMIPRHSSCVQTHCHDDRIDCLCDFVVHPFAEDEQSPCLIVMSDLVLPTS